MVITILADVVEIVVLSAGADAFLRVGRAFQLGKVGIGVHGFEEDGFVLVHPSIGKEEGGIVEGDNGGGGH